MLFNVFITIKGPAKSLEVPSTFNPYQSENLASLLNQLKDNLPRNKNLQLETVGIRIEMIEEEKEIDPSELETGV